MARYDSLSNKTLQRTKGYYAPIWNYAGHFDIDDGNKGPPVGLVNSRSGNKVTGRFFPNASIRAHKYKGPAILVHNHSDPIITKATVVHELAHWASYCEECDHVPRNLAEASRCRYDGEHDPEFYARLEPMYRAAGIPTYAARAVEGKYDYPAHWKEDEWP